MLIMLLLSLSGCGGTMRAVGLAMQGMGGGMQRASSNYKPPVYEDYKPEPIECAKASASFVKANCKL